MHNVVREGNKCSHRRELLQRLGWTARRTAGNGRNGADGARGSPIRFLSTQPLFFLMAPPVILRDYRSPSQAMETLAIKIPPAYLQLLMRQADRHGCSRAVLARTLLLQALEAAAGEEVE